MSGPVEVTLRLTEEQVAQWRTYHFASNLISDIQKQILAQAKPAEPTGLGAVVEDAAGARWTWAGERDINDRQHWRQESTHLGRTYDRIDAVRALSEGVA